MLEGRGWVVREASLITDYLGRDLEDPGNGLAKEGFWHRGAV